MHWYIFSLQKMQISNDVIDCLRSNSNGTKLIEIMSSVTQEEREYIMRCYIKPEKQTVFFNSCVTQPLSVVEYLLKNCKPDVNYKSYFKDEAAVFPLWFAARSSKLELVKLLIEHGADVNAKTRSGQTAIHAACQENNFEIVKVLDNAGADVNSADNEGGTCLMATNNINIVKYLLNKGVDLNVRTTSGETALHVSVRRNHDLSKIHALVEAGADITIPGIDGDSPLIYAATIGNTVLFTYLLEKTPLSLESKFKAFVLLATSLITNIGKSKEGLQQLHMAYDLLPEGYELPELSKHITHFFPAVRVPRTSKDVMQLPNDFYALQEVAIVLVTQYVEFESEFMLSRLLTYVDIFRDEYGELSLEMCSFVYNVLLSRKQWLDINVEDCVCLNVYFLGRLCLEQTPMSYDLQLEFDTLMNRLTNNIIMASKEEKFIAREDSDLGSCFQNLMIAVLYMVSMCITCELRDENMKSDLRRLARLNPQTMKGKSLLHILVDKCTLRLYAQIDLYPLYPALDLDVISCLVEQGFPLDTQCNAGKTPLSYVLSHNYLSSRLTQEENDEEIRRSEIVGKYLLEKGAYPDVQSCALNRTVPVFEDYNIPPVNYMTLKCLAANAVVAHNIPYHDEMLPVEVKSFIELHAPYKHDKQYQTDILHESLD